MENDLISRSALCEKLQANKDFFVNAWGGFGNLPPKDKARVDEITHCIAETMNAPSVDAVIPVRCKDCEYVHEYQQTGCGCVSLSCENENAPWYTTEHAIFVEENFYCKYGERRADHDAQ